MGISKHLKTVQTIFVTVILVVSTPVGLRLFSDYQTGNLFHFGFHNPIILISLLFFAILIPVANRIFNAQMKGEFYTAGQIFGKYTSAVAVKGVTIGTAGMFNAVVYIFTGNFAVLVVSLFSIILLVRTFPTLRGIMKNCGVTKEDFRDDGSQKINEN